MMMALLLGLMAASGAADGSTRAFAPHAATNTTDRVENGGFDAAGQLRAWTPGSTTTGGTASGSAAWDASRDAQGNPASGAAYLRNTSPVGASGTTSYGLQQCLRPGVPAFAASPSAANFFPARLSVLVPAGQNPAPGTASVDVLALFYASSDCSGAPLGAGGASTPVTVAGSGGWLALNPAWTAGAFNTFAATRSVAVRAQVSKQASVTSTIEAWVDDLGLRGTYQPIKGDLNRDGETDIFVSNTMTGEQQVYLLKDETRLPAATPAVAHVATAITYAATASAPAGVLPGDLMIAGVLAQPAVVAPAGWTRLGAEIPCGPGAFRFYGSYWYRLWRAGDASWTWTNSAATQIAVYRNVDQGAPFVASDVALHGEPGGTPTFSIALPSLVASATGDAAHYQSLGIYHAAFAAPANYVDRAIGRADSTTSGDRLGLTAGQASSGTLTLVDNFDSGAHLHAVLRAARNTGVAISPATASLDWKVAGVDDFNADGEQDLLMWNAVTGAVEFWLMNGSARVGPALPLTGALAPPWKPSATADFNHDGQPDVVYRNSTTQAIVVWTLGGTTKVGEIVPNPAQAAHANWEIVGTVDLDRDGNVDFLWYNASSGKLVYWLMNASVVRLVGNFTNPGNAGDANWKVLATGDYGIGPGAGARADTPDVVWRNATSGRAVVWYLDGAGNRTSGVFVTPDPAAPATSWTLAGPR